MELGDATMEGSFTVELFDILVYLLPGLIVLTAANWVWRGVHESVPNVGPAAKVACILLLAFFIGVLAHIVAAGGATVGSKVTRYFILDRTLAHFAEFDQVSRVVEKRIGTALPDRGVVYRYAENYVVEKAGRQSSSVSRLIALSLFCRNSLLPVAGLGVAWLWRKRRTPVQLAFAFVAVGCVEAVLVAGWINYYSAAVNKVLRTFVMMNLA